MKTNIGEGRCKWTDTIILFSLSVSKATQLWDLQCVHLKKRNIRYIKQCQSKGGKFVEHYVYNVIDAQCTVTKATFKLLYVFL